jgi:hypothetical protein
MADKQNPIAVAPRSVAAALNEVIFFLRYTAYNRDVWLGTNLTSSIQERLQDIGSLQESEDLYATEDRPATLQTGRNNKPTLQAQLVHLKSIGLAAIEAARQSGNPDEGEEETDDFRDTDSENTVVRPL